ncbi:hypothetical protein [Bradyrhizobium sp. McL0616]|uniref:hypothetical protein n=1 Tax=Bradyrhizobium sp. McL0616 TaxID=3415674 RepID=UPI003CE729DD
MIVSEQTGVGKPNAPPENKSADKAIGLAFGAAVVVTMAAWLYFLLRVLMGTVAWCIN